MNNADKRILPMVYGRQCYANIGYNVCTPMKVDHCMPQCILAIGQRIDKATCMIHSDGTSYCECLWTCAAHANHEEQSKIATAFEPVSYWIFGSKRMMYELYKYLWN